MITKLTHTSMYTWIKVGVVKDYYAGLILQCNTNLCKLIIPHIICINKSCTHNCSFMVLLFCTYAVENTEWPLSGVTCRDSNIAANWLNPTFPFRYYNYVDKLRLNATCLYGTKTDLKVLTG